MRWVAVCNVNSNSNCVAISKRYFGNNTRRNAPQQRRGNWQKDNRSFGQHRPQRQHTQQQHPPPREDVLYGVFPVWGALQAKRRQLHTLYIKESLVDERQQEESAHKTNELIPRIFRLAQDIGVSVRPVSVGVLDSFSKNNVHQGVVLDASPLNFEYLERLEAPPPPAADKASPVWIALDGVTDPVNLGSIVRSGTFFGVSGIISYTKHSPPITAAVSKASAGAVEFIQLYSTDNLQSFLTLSKQNGWRVVGAKANDKKSVDLKQLETDKPTILVLGSEGEGIRTVVARCCDSMVRIASNCSSNEGSTAIRKQRSSFVDSLNVNVACAVFLQHLLGK